MTISGRRRFSARAAGRHRKRTGEPPVPATGESSMRRRGLWSGVLALLALASAAPAQQSPDLVERALNTIKQLGGQVVVDEKSPGQPILRVDLNGPRVTDSVVAQLRGF